MKRIFSVRAATGVFAKVPKSATRVGKANHYPAGIAKPPPTAAFENLLKTLAALGSKANETA